MPNVSETIPDALRSEVDAALHWWNGQQDVTFEVTGILDVDEALAGSESRTLRLVLCGGDLCEMRAFRVAAHGDAGHRVSLLEDPSPAVGGAETVLQPELDPPPGPRRAWLDGVLAQHPFVVLLFYRGFW